MSWYNESVRHALARMGVKTAPQKPKSSPRPAMGVEAQPRVVSDDGYEMGERREAKQMSKAQVKALDNQVQRQVLGFGRLVSMLDRKQVVTDDEVSRLLSEYDQSKMRVLEYEERVGGLPYWVSQDWVGQEDWRGTGLVRSMIDALMRCEDNDDRKRVVRDLNMLVNRRG